MGGTVVSFEVLGLLVYSAKDMHESFLRKMIAMPRKGVATASILLLKYYASIHMTVSGQCRLSYSQLFIYAYVCIM